LENGYNIYEKNYSVSSFNNFIQINGILHF